MSEGSSPRRPETGARLAATSSSLRPRSGTSSCSARCSTISRLGRARPVSRKLRCRAETPASFERSSWESRRRCRQVRRREPTGGEVMAPTVGRRGRRVAYLAGNRPDDPRCATVLSSPQQGADREDTVMSDFPTLAERYIAVWNETDPDARRRAVAELWTDDARYVDPLGEAQGPAEIAATIGAVQGRFPGFVFRLTGPVDGHHDQLRFSWELGPAGRPAPIAGSDVAVTDGNGRLRTVLGFLDRVPS